MVHPSVSVVCVCASACMCACVCVEKIISLEVCLPAQRSDWPWVTGHACLQGGGCDAAKRCWRKSFSPGFSALEDFGVIYMKTV